MAEQDNVPENTIPPKVTPFAKVPAPAAQAPAPGSPRRTSRIPLTGAIPPMMTAAPTGQSRTIRIKPVGAPQPGSSPIPDGLRPPTEAQIQASKSKTSRISLDAAIGVEAAAAAPALAQPADEAPKTIRLKRPTEMPTVKVAIVPQPAAAQVPVAAPAAAKSTTPIPQVQAPPPSQTARIADPVVAPDNAPITQKRTIRVKRPASIVVGGGEPAAGGEEGGDAQAAAEQPAVVAFAPDTAHPLFIVAAILLILVSVGLAIVYSSQIFGPNASLTELSIWPTGPDFPLPGTVSGN